MNSSNDELHLMQSIMDGASRLSPEALVYLAARVQAAAAAKLHLEAGRTANRAAAELARDALVQPQRAAERAQQAVAASYPPQHKRAERLEAERVYTPSSDEFLNWAADPARPDSKSR